MVAKRNLAYRVGLVLQGALTLKGVTGMFRQTDRQTDRQTNLVFFFYQNNLKLYPQLKQLYNNFHIYFVYFLYHVMNLLTKECMEKLQTSDFSFSNGNIKHLIGTSILQ